MCICRKKARPVGDHASEWARGHVMGGHIGVAHKHSCRRCRPRLKEGLFSTWTHVLEAWPQSLSWFGLLSVTRGHPRVRWWIEHQKPLHAARPVHKSIHPKRIARERCMMRGYAALCSGRNRWFSKFTPASLQGQLFKTKLVIMGNKTANLHSRNIVCYNTDAQTLISVQHIWGLRMFTLKCWLQNVLWTYMFIHYLFYNSRTIYQYNFQRHACQILFKCAIKDGSQIKFFLTI